MKIYSSKRPKEKSGEYLFLESINWNDYSYRSSFELYYYNGTREIHIGELKVIDENIYVGSVEISTTTEGKLSSNLCSLGQTENYYKNLKKLKDEDAIKILKALNDSAFNELIYEHFKDLEQFKSSAVRFSTAEQALNFGKEIFNRDPVNVVEPCHSFTFNSLLKGFENEHKLKFNFFDKEAKIIPANINVLIGRNGTGKTQLLSDMAKAISGYGFENKEELIQSRDTKFGSSKPSFGNVIVISYSAFDNFEIPGKDQQEKDELASVGHVHGYKYCGLRERINDTQYRLKDISEISDEFTMSYRKIKKDEMLNEWFECIEHVLNDPSFQGLDRLNLQKSFKKLSSGQKIILSILAGVYEHIDNNSLIILDEPETHLHPSLMSAFMHSLRDILRRFDSYAIIATHSPVILQETPSLFVQVLGGSSRNPRVRKLKIESFGEEISTLTEDVFHVSYEESNFYKTLTDLSNRGYSAGDLDELFEKRLGFTAKSFIESL